MSFVGVIEDWRYVGLIQRAGFREESRAGMRFLLTDHRLYQRNELRIFEPEISLWVIRAACRLLAQFGEYQLAGGFVHMDCAEKIRQVQEFPHRALRRFFIERHERVHCSYFVECS